MMGWPVLAVYVLGYLFTARRVALYLIEEDASREREHRAEMRKPLYGRQPEEKTTPLVSAGDRVMYTFMGFMAALVWPVLAVVWATARSLRSPSERIEADQQELRALRKLAREHNLPMPGDES